MTCSVTIMAHPTRRKFVDQLFLCLDRHAEVVWDRVNDRWETGRRALLSYDPSCSHHVVIQDDAIPCRDFIASAERCADVVNENPIGFYIGRVRPHRETVTPAVKRALENGDSWFVHEGPWWGVAIAIPTPHIEPMVKWCDTRPEVENYDRKISRWYYHEGLPCWYTIPSLVEHRPVNENPSLIHGRIGNRQAHEFIGVDRSGLEIDWEAGIPEVAA